MIVESLAPWRDRACGRVRARLSCNAKVRVRDIHYLDGRHMGVPYHCMMDRSWFGWNMRYMTSLRATIFATRPLRYVKVVGKVGEVKGGGEERRGEEVDMATVVSGITKADAA